MERNVVTWRKKIAAAGASTGPLTIDGGALVAPPRAFGLRKKLRRFVYMHSSTSNYRLSVPILNLSTFVSHVLGARRGNKINNAQFFRLSVPTHYDNTCTFVPHVVSYGTCTERGSTRSIMFDVSVTLHNPFTFLVSLSRCLERVRTKSVSIMHNCYRLSVPIHNTSINCV